MLKGTLAQKHTILWENWITFSDLVSSMRDNKHLHDHNVEFYVDSIQKEDGSGRSWNITFYVVGDSRKHIMYWHEKSKFDIRHMRLA